MTDVILGMNSLQNLLIGLLVCLLSTPVFAGKPDYTGATVYSVAIVPQQEPIVIQRRWQPFLEELSRRTGLDFKLVIRNSIPDFENTLRAGTADFAYMNPYHQVMARRQHGYIPIVRSGAKQLHGILVVHSNSGITNVQQLDGDELVFPSPNAFGASLYMRTLLAEKEHISITARYVDTHANVYRSVVMDRAIAGGGVNKTLGNESITLRKALRIIYRTPGSAPHPFSADAHVPVAVRQRVRDAIITMANTHAGRLLLEKVQLSKPIKADYARDYAPLEKLGLEKYVGKE